CSLKHLIKAFHFSVVRDIFPVTRVFKKREPRIEAKKPHTPRNSHCGVPRVLVGKPFSKGLGVQMHHLCDADRAPLDSADFNVSAPHGSSSVPVVRDAASWPACRSCFMRVFCRCCARMAPRRAVRSSSKRYTFTSSSESSSPMVWLGGSGGCLLMMMP